MSGESTIRTIRLIGAMLVITTGCSDTTTAADSSGVSGDSTSGGPMSRALSDEQRQLLDAEIGAGTADRVVATGQNAKICAALDGAVKAAMELDAAKGNELVALLSTRQAPMANASDALNSAGFTRTAQHWTRYREALAATVSDIDLADPASRERANQRFRTVKAMGAGSTETELGALATVCGIG